MLALVEGLSPDAVSKLPEHGWTRLEQIVALHAEVADYWGHQAAVVGGVKPSKLPPLLDMGRPMDTPPKGGSNRVVTDAREIAAFFSKTGG